MATVTFDLDELRAKHLASDPPQEPDVAQQQQSYWSPEFHTPDNLLREEHWAPPIRRFLLPGAANPTIIQLRLEAGTAVLRLVEEVKMYANLEAETTRCVCSPFALICNCVPPHSSPMLPTTFRM
jgi:hypothetical protein